MKHRLPVVLLAAPLALIAPRADALCLGVVVTATSVLFGTYSPFSGSAVDSTGAVAVTCTIGLGVSYTIKLGSGGSGTYSPRRLSSGASTINYNLYTSAARTTVWGDGSGSTGTISFSTLLEVIGLRRYTVYGRIPASQNVAAGAYADSVVVTVEY